MNVIDTKEKIERIDRLISLKATGTPEEFAYKLNLNVRTIYRIINQLKEMGVPIYYDRNRKSYCYESSGSLKLIFEQKTKKI